MYRAGVPLEQIQHQLAGFYDAQELHELITDLG
jgi:hypothetical protein